MHKVCVFAFTTDEMCAFVSVWWSWRRTFFVSWWIWCSVWCVTENWVWHVFCGRTFWIKWNRRDSCDTRTRSNPLPRWASLPGNGQSSGVCVGDVRFVFSDVLIGSLSEGRARCMISAVTKSPISWPCWTQSSSIRSRYVYTHLVWYLLNGCLNVCVRLILDSWGSALGKGAEWRKESQSHPVHGAL